MNAQQEQTKSDEQEFQDFVSDILFVSDIWFDHTMSTEEKTQMCVDQHVESTDIYIGIMVAIQQAIGIASSNSLDVMASWKYLGEVR